MQKRITFQLIDEQISNGSEHNQKDIENAMKPGLSGSYEKQFAQT